MPVRFDVGAPTVARRRRCAFVGAQLVVPILLLLGAGAVAVATRSGIPVTFGQLAIIAWLMSGAWALRPVARRLELPPTEAVRLQRRWSPLVAAVTIACDFVLTVGVVALWGALGG